MHCHHLSSLQACQFMRPLRYLWLSTEIRRYLRWLCILKRSLWSQLCVSGSSIYFFPQSLKYHTGHVRQQPLRDHTRDKQLLIDIAADSELRLENKSTDERLAWLLAFFSTFSLRGATFKTKSSTIYFLNAKKKIVFSCI